ncbi:MULTISPECIES: site-specific integrase [Thauera]|uniref:Integrase n=1 Tax=Thauera aminoaromatica S2 TaxID=1234381 RepID=N6Y124_THASP|nr:MULTISPECIES: site-specific integrase [Thauera]ENO87846.1 integrase [Thauera aminoaromatica S2]
MDKGTHQNRASVERTTLADVLLRYAEEVTPCKKGAKDEAIRLNALRANKLAKHSLANLSAAAVAKFRDERLKTVSAGTVLRDLALISSVLNHARREWGLPVENAVQAIRKPRQPQGRERVLSHDEEASLLTASAPVGRRSPWLQPIIILALETAMRRGELLALRWEHVSLDKRTALLPDTKNGTRRLVPLSPRAIDTLKHMARSIDGRVFPISEPALHLRFKLACERAGIGGLHFHDLRHTATTRLAEKLTNLAELSAVTGHKSLQMLKRYYHPNAEALAEKLARHG